MLGLDIDIKYRPGYIFSGSSIAYGKSLIVSIAWRVTYFIFVGLLITRVYAVWKSEFNTGSPKVRSICVAVVASYLVNVFPFF